MYVSQLHDYRLLYISTSIGLLACASAMALFDRIGETRGLSRAAWLGITATVTGVGVWATHFIAMLGYRSALAASFDPIGTLASLLAAILLLALAIHVAVGTRLKYGPALGGALAGAAVGVMHYLGMAAFWVGGRRLWDMSLVAASLVAGVGLGALGFHAALRGKGPLRKVWGALILTMAICGLHFIGMSAVSMLSVFGMAAPHGVVNDLFLGRWVAGTAAGLLLISVSALIIGQRQRLAEERRLGELADAAVEGLAICDVGVIVTANASLSRMAGAPAASLAGRAFVSLFEDGYIPGGPALCSGERVEARICSAGCDAIPVELLAHDLCFYGKPRTAVPVRDLRDRMAAEAKMRFLAHHDGLTGLANRQSFIDRLERETQLHRRREDNFAVLYLDLDRFKQVNDVLGHAAGDLVLKTVAERVSASLGASDVLARLGGDEFALICLDTPRPADIARLCDRILKSIRQEIQIDEIATTVGACIGIALYPQDGDTAALLERNADAALYQAKNGGRDGYRFFEAGLSAKLHDRQTMEFDLRRALGRKELRVIYQPQVSTQTRAIFGFEALVRWNSPTRGAVGPNVFIPLAEETGLIGPIGEWVLREACTEAARWPKPLQIAVNISGVQLRSPALPRLIHDILREVGLAPERLEIEITETALIEDFDQAMRILREIKASGVKVAMDDFGTGYSSLSNLRAFPFDKIKIDRSFVCKAYANEDSAAIVRAIIGLCKGLNLAVLAEGVETADEMRFLANEHCPQAQGYLFGRPGEIGEFPEAFAADIVQLAIMRQQRGSSGC
jgi:diguanylate cyclase (GGDEF)-like protein